MGYWCSTACLLNLLLANVLIFYPLKTPSNQRFSGAFREYKMGTLARIGLMDTDQGLVMNVFTIVATVGFSVLRQRDFIYLLVTLKIHTLKGIF